MVCVSCTLQMEGKSKEIFAKLHNDLNNKVAVAMTDQMICHLISPIYPNKNNGNLYVFTFLGAQSFYDL